MGWVPVDLSLPGLQAVDGLVSRGEREGEGRGGERSEGRGERKEREEGEEGREETEGGEEAEFFLKIKKIEGSAWVNLPSKYPYPQQNPSTYNPPFFEGEQTSAKDSFESESVGSQPALGDTITGDDPNSSI
jgi:hypothetical protein